MLRFQIQANLDFFRALKVLKIGSVWIRKKHPDPHYLMKDSKKKVEKKLKKVNILLVLNF
jgi:hypothetical protein